MFATMGGVMSPTLCTHGRSLTLAARISGVLAAGTVFLAGFIGCGRSSGPVDQGPVDAGGSEPSEVAVQTPDRIRVAVFNIRELSGEKLVAVDEAGRGTHPQLRSAAEILQWVRPDVVLIQEIDYDAEDARAEGRRSSAELFLDRYLSVSWNGLEPLSYRHVFYEPVNTGVPSGFDLDRDEEIGGPGDALGWGEYPGQYGMVLYSRFPLDREAARTFRTLRWQAMPGHVMPDGKGDRPDWYGDEASELPLSSKSHWDVPVAIGPEVLHVLASHPTPPVFDGPEDRNGRRNFDEIRLWADYLTGGGAVAWLVDDEGRRGGLDRESPSVGKAFVLLGDLNADPHFEPVTYHGRTAIGQLLDHPRVQDPEPTSSGAHAGERDYPGPVEHVTADFGLRADYVLPSAELEVLDAGVFWPPQGDPLHPLVEGEAAASDHRLVWVDLAWPPG